jgi:hypothetical protein
LGSEFSHPICLRNEVLLLDSCQFHKSMLIATL